MFKYLAHAFAILSQFRLCGTAPYLSPEAKGGSWCNASDIWSVGLTIWECWSRLPPPKSYVWDSVNQTVDVEKLKWPHACHPNLKGLIEACLKYSPAERLDCEQLLELPFLTRAATTYRSMAMASYFDRRWKQYLFIISCFSPSSCVILILYWRSLLKCM